jgi:hypothetical protein
VFVKTTRALGIAALAPLAAAVAFGQLPLYIKARPSGDWLLGQSGAKTMLYRSDRGIVLSNGLISREFRLSPNCATIAIDNLMTGEELLRAVGQEAAIEVDGKRITVGGLQGQPDRAFLMDSWIPSLTPIPGSLAFQGYKIGEPEERLPWIRTRHHVEENWPPKGKSLTLRFGGDGIEVDVRYEMFDGIPLMGKRLVVVNHRSTAFHLTGFELENLAMVEAESDPDPQEWRKPNLTELTDYRFAGQDSNPSWQPVSWLPDPLYTSQVNWSLLTPCQLQVKCPIGPDAILEPGKSLKSFWTYMLVHDSTDRERQGLGVRHMMRTLAPWTSENPIMLHLTSTDPVVAKQAIDQAAAVGFEMVILSFGSGLDMEDVTPANIARYRALAAYAHSKGLQIGGYSLLASRSIDAQDDAINPKTGKNDGAVFGTSPCLGSNWGIAYFQHLQSFLAGTKFDLLEHDGSYPGDVCASTTHPGHRGLADSQWNQFQQIAEFYRWCRGRGMYLNVPDNYFLAGSNKTGMGYREDNWSLPRALQHIHARQNLYDGTWLKTPSMGWMFTPLVQYHGGGDAATIEPLKDHLTDYALHLMNNFGYGVQSCFRGPRLYDSEATKAMVTHWVSWFKAHREILESDVIHVKRADGRNLDAVLHVNPSLPTPAMAVIYNPLDQSLAQEIVLPLYYSGLHDVVRYRVNDGPEQTSRLSKGQKLVFTSRVPGRSCVWVTFEK